MGLHGHDSYDRLGLLTLFLGCCLMDNLTYLVSKKYHKDNENFFEIMLETQIYFTSSLRLNMGIHPYLVYSSVISSISFQYPPASGESPDSRTLPIVGIGAIIIEDLS
jgi:hypothetical protein